MTLPRIIPWLTKIIALKTPVYLLRNSPVSELLMENMDLTARENVMTRKV